MDHNAANLVSPAFSISFNGKDSFSQKSLAGVPFIITQLLKGPTHSHSSLYIIGISLKSK